MLKCFFFNLTYLDTYGFCRFDIGRHVLWIMRLKKNIVMALLSEWVREVCPRNQRDSMAKCGLTSFAYFLEHYGKKKQTTLRHAGFCTMFSSQSKSYLPSFLKANITLKSQRCLLGIRNFNAQI